MRFVVIRRRPVGCYSLQGKGMCYHYSQSYKYGKVIAGINRFIAQEMTFFYFSYVIMIYASNHFLYWNFFQLDKLRITLTYTVKENHSFSYSIWIKKKKIILNSVYTIYANSNHHEVSGMAVIYRKSELRNWDGNFLVC